MMRTDNLFVSSKIENQIIEIVKSQTIIFMLCKGQNSRIEQRKIH